MDEKPSERRLCEITWITRRLPLAPAAVVGCGPAAVRLAGRTLERSDEMIARLSGSASSEVLVLIGDADDLPWADGVVYLGRVPDAPGLLLPTYLEPNLPSVLLERALQNRFPGAAMPLAVLPREHLVIPLGTARTVERDVLQRWLRENE